MDAAKYDQKRFEEVKKDLSALMQMVGYKPSETLFIPTSALQGTNISKKSPDTPWYTGPTLLESLDTLKEPEKPIDKPLRLPIQDVYSISGIGTVPVGRVETGVMKKGMKVSFQPANKDGEIKSIEMHHEEIPQALPGDNIGFNVRGLAKGDIRRGDVCGPVDAPPTVADEFTAQIVVLQHPSAITIGYTPVFHCHTTQTACTFIELKKKLDPRTGETKEENPTFIKAGDAAIIQVKPTKPMVIENVKEIPQLGRFAIRDMGSTIAAGMCIAIQPKQMR
jgi:elongation factor 1-alpha